MPEPTQKPSKAAAMLADLNAKFDALNASMRRRPAAHDEDDEVIDPSDKRTLTGRLSVVTSQRRAAEESAAAALKLAADLKAAHAEELAEVRAAAAVAVTAGVRNVEQGYALRSLMVEADDDGVATARRLYDAIPENKRPDSIVEWFKGLTPDAAPKTLRAYLPAPAAEEQQTTTPARQPPRVDVGRGKATDPDPSKMTAEQYEAWLESKRAERMG